MSKKFRNAEGTISAFSIFTGTKRDKHMKKVLTLILTIWILSIPIKAEAQRNPLNQFKGKNRIVLIKVDNFNSIDYQKQRELYLKDLMGLDTRDLTFVGVGVDRAEFWTMSNVQLSKDECQWLRNEFLGGSSQVLVGKDGTVKSRTSSAFTLDELYRTIDSMPMRKNEMSRQGGNEE